MTRLMIKDFANLRAAIRLNDIAGVLVGMETHMAKDFNEV